MELSEKELTLLRLVVRDGVHEAFKEFEVEHQKVHDKQDVVIEELKTFMWRVVGAGTLLALLSTVVSLALAFKQATGH